MYGYGWRPYVPVAVRRRRAEQEVRRLAGKGMKVEPVSVAGRAIAESFWGSSWCGNLERYSDYANRLPRGRTYVRNGSVMHLEVRAGKVEALVSGSEIYRVSVEVDPLPAPRWKAIRRDCAGSIESLVELLQGRLSRGVMERVCREGTGLFPSPKEIRIDCSCPDWADLCKHAAAVLYGVGVRLDRGPELLFKLRSVDPKDLVAGAAEEMTLDRKGGAGRRVLEGADISAVFGIEMEGTARTAPPSPEATHGAPPPRTTRARKPKRKAGGNPASSKRPGRKKGTGNPKGR